MSDNFKFKEIKIYAEDEWLYGSQKKYRTVFEQQNVKYIDAEVSLFNKKFDEEEWELELNLKAFDSKGTQLCDLPVKRKVLKDENIIFIRNGWGNANGTFWKRGSYRWEAHVDGKSIGSANFYVENQGKVTNFMLKIRARLQKQVTLTLKLILLNYTNQELKRILK